MMLSHWYRNLEERLATYRRKEPMGNPTWFRSPSPPQPRSPWLTAKLEAQAARQRAKVKRAARRLLDEAGFGDVGVL